MNVYLVHGFNVRDGGKASVGVLSPYLASAGMTVHQPHYGWLGLLGVRLINEKLASMLAGCIDPGSCIIAHSNGCDLVRRASFMDCSKFSAILINPALDVDSKFGKSLDRALVMFNRGDWPCWLAQWRVWSSWGAMGTYGPKTDDPRITPLDCWPLADGHSAVFKRPRLWLPPMLDFMREGDVAVDGFSRAQMAPNIPLQAP